jgi:flagellar basal body P-ring formation protein FlgA
MIILRAVRPLKWLGWLALASLVFALLSGQVHASTMSFPTLKANPVASGPQIFLGDIFDNAGPAASTPLARAPGPGQRVVFGAPSLQSRASTAGLRWLNSEGVRNVTINGPEPMSSQANAYATGSVSLAVLARNVARGETLGADDIVWMDAPAFAPRDAITDPEVLIGKTAKRALQPNMALRATDVMETPAIRRGEAVTLMFDSGGIRLSVRGRALADGVTGAQIKILNPQSNKTLDAIVEGPGLARVLASPNVGRVVAQLGTR